MTNRANWNYIKPELLSISLVVVVVTCLSLIANRTNQSLSVWDFIIFNGMINSLACVVFFRVVNSGFFMRRPLRNLPLFCLPIFFGVFLLVLSICVSVILLVLFMPPHFIGAVVLKISLFCFRYFFDVVYCILPDALNNALTMPLIIFFMVLSEMRRIFFLVFLATIFASGIASIFLTFVYMKVIKRFYLFAFTTPFIHRIPQTKMPAASWVKHDTEGGFILTRNALLDPMHLFIDGLYHR